MLGAVVLYKVEIVISLIPFILGVLVLCSGCSKLQDAIDLKRLDYGSWLGLLIVAAINIILGVVLISIRSKQRFCCSVFWEWY